MKKTNLDAMTKTLETAMLDYAMNNPSEVTTFGQWNEAFTTAKRRIKWKFALPPKKKARAAKAGR